MSEPTDDLQRGQQPATGDPDAAASARSQLPAGGGGGGGLLAIGAVAMLLAVVAFVLMRALGTADTPPANPKKAATAAAVDLPDVSLDLFVERDGKAEALPPGTRVAVGDRILFKLASDEPAEVRLWIEEDGLTIQDLGVIEADPTPSMIGADDGMLAWGFGAARTVTVRASAAKRGCPAASCASQVVIAK